MGACTRTDLRTTASATVFAMFFSQWFFFGCCLKGAQRLGPHLVEVRAQPCHALRIQLIEPPRSGLAVGHQTGILEYAQVLRDRGTADRQGASQLVHGSWTGRQLLKDRHARAI